MFLSKRNERDTTIIQYVKCFAVVVFKKININQQYFFLVNMKLDTDYKITNSCCKHEA